jgi:hypothetical protein
MLDNALELKAQTGDVTVSLVDTDDGKTIRSANFGGGNKVDLMISNAESKENSNVLSDRYLVRVDETVTEVTAPYSPTKISAYLVLVVPRRPDITTTKIRSTVERLISVFYNGSLSPVLDNATIFARLLAGEK